MLNVEFHFTRIYHSLQYFHKVKIILLIVMSKYFLPPHDFLETVTKNDNSPENLQPIRLCVQHTQSPVGNLYFQPDAFIHT